MSKLQHFKFLTKGKYLSMEEVEKTSTSGITYCYSSEADKCIEVLNNKIKQLKGIVETEKQLNRNKIELMNKEVIKFIDLECLKEELENELETSLLFHNLAVQERDLERVKVNRLEEEMKTLQEQCDGYRLGADAEARQVDEQFKIITKLREEMDTLKEHCRNVVGYKMDADAEARQRESSNSGSSGGGRGGGHRR